MRPAEFSPELILQAGADLQAAGRNVTGFALRQRVGGGNPARLKQVWDEHLNGNGAAPAAPLAELPGEVMEQVVAISTALGERIAALAVELNDKAVRAAERRVAEVVRTAGEQRALAERELADAAQTLDDIESRLEGAQGDITGLQAKLDAALATAQAQAVELAALKAKAEADQITLVAQRQRAGDELVQANARATTAEHARDAAQQDVGAAREEAARLRGQVEALQEQHAALLAVLDKRPGV